MRFIVFIAFFILTVLPFNLFAQYEVMFSDSYPPYNYKNEQGEMVGFNVDILKAIQDLYEADINIKGDSWTVINEALENNEIHAIGGAHFTGSTDHRYTFTRSTINTSHCFLYNVNYVRNFTLEYFRTQKEPKVAMWKNDVLIHYVLSVNPSAQLLFIDNYDELIHKLEDKDICCVFGKRVGGMYFAEKHGKDFVAASEHRILERNMGFKVAVGSPGLAKLLNNGLEVILANGEYQRIHDKWITEYDRSPNDWHQYLKSILIGSAFVIVLIVLLIVFNRVLQIRVRNRTADLEQQLQLNSEIMKELEKQKNKAEESDKMKTAFLANMSHEIRTPMNGILGFAELLKDDDVSPEEQEHYIGIIQKSGHRMLSTINNIIEVSKLESGAEVVQIQRVDIKSMMQEFESFFRAETDAKDLKLYFYDQSVEIPTEFHTDEHKLNSILTNLIKNAIKFTNIGSIQVKYKIGKQKLEFSVTDTGIGIAKEKQDSIFEQFVQADFSHSNGYEGSGLGLSISKGYTSLLQGQLKMASQIGKGTEFVGWIPNKKNSD